MTNPEPIISKQLQFESAGVRHGYFTRVGGVSTGIYRGLNVGLGSKDEPVSVISNRAKVAAHFNVTPDQLVTAYQVHSDRALHVSKPLGNERPQVDALVTNKPGIAIGILTADCGPVLFCDPQNHVIGAAHAGWKGATGGVLENTLLEMEKIGAQRKNIHAVLGPTISQKNYEVGPEFAEHLEQMDCKNQKYLTPSNTADHKMFDLPGYIVDRLNSNGVDATWTEHCTYESEENFFSYRRTTHRDEPDYGRQISVITLTK